MSRSFDPHPSGGPLFEPPGDRDDAPPPQEAEWDPPGKTWAERETLLAIVPPSGALPRRFGASAASATLTRAAVVVSIAAFGIAVAAQFVRDILPDSITGPALAALVPLAGFAASNLFGKRARMPLAVDFEYSGVTIVYPWTARRFGWGELIGLAGLVPRSGEWVLHARRGTKEWRIPLDASKPWIGAMLEELTGAPGVDAPD